jgi:hypothetical protein
MLDPQIVVLQRFGDFLFFIHHFSGLKSGNHPNFGPLFEKV